MMKKVLLALCTVASALDASPMTLTLNVQNETCSYANGSVTAVVQGGVPPYSYIWGGGEITESISGLSAGTYSVTVTDFLGDQVSDQATVVSESYPPITGITHGYCPGQNYHDFFFSPPQAGVPSDPAYWYTTLGSIGEAPPPAGPGSLYLDLGTPAPGSSYGLTYSDINGCSGTMTGVVGYPITGWPSFAVMAIEGSCSNYASGSVTFSSTPDIDGDTYYVLKPEGSGEYEWISTYGSLGNYLYKYTALAPGNYWLLIRLGFTYSLVQGEGCKSDSILVTIPDLGPGCGRINGSTYMDYNSDCTNNDGGGGAQVVVEVQPGPYYASANGNYSIPVPNGTYTVTTTGAAVVQSCPADATVDNNTVLANVGHQATVPLDLAINMGSGPARPGFLLNYSMGLFDQSTAASGAITTTFTFDPTLTFVTAEPAPTSVLGNTLTWNQASLGAYQMYDYHITLQVPPDIGLIGTDLQASASVTSVNADGDLSNNDDTFNTTVTASFDPNDKVARTSSGYSDGFYYLDQDHWIDYVIRFQNTGTDTAFNIVVTDTLPATLDPATIAMVTASHDFTWSVGGHGVLRALFPNILLPDSNANEAASHGLVAFRVRPRLPLVPGTLIENTANIFFDYNPPVITEPSVLVVEQSTSIMERYTGIVGLWPNPASTSITVVAERTSSVAVFDLSGAQLPIPMQRQAGTVIIGIEQLPRGIYAVRTDAGTARFVKR